MYMCSSKRHACAVGFIRGCKSKVGKSPLTLEQSLNLCIRYSPQLSSALTTSILIYISIPVRKTYHFAYYKTLESRMVRSSSIQKRSNFEDTRRLTRRERLHQLCADAANPSAIRTFESLAHLQDRKPRWFANRHSRRRRAREHKRKELLDLQLATLDTELSSRVDHVITNHQRNSNVQLSALDPSPMQMIKWEPSKLSPVHTPTTRLCPVSDEEWSKLEIMFSSPIKKTTAFPSPPSSFMTTAKLCLPTPLAPSARTQTLVANSRADVASLSLAPIITPCMPKFPIAAHLQDPDLALDDPFSPFVAAKLPHFHEIDPFDLTAPPIHDIELSKYELFSAKPQATACMLYRDKTGHDVEEYALDFSQSLRGCEEGRTSGLVPTVPTATWNVSPEVQWFDEPVMDWPYDALGDWNNEPFLGWNCEPVADCNDEVVGCSEDLVIVEHDAETCDWTFLSDKDAVPSSFISIDSSGFSSVEVLPLPLRDSFMEESSSFEGPVRKLANDDLEMHRVAKSAWESESDFCIPAFFWEGDKSLSEEVFESAVFAVYPVSKEDDRSWDW
ncbi:hypothetical protein E4T39_04561 [Aureobasidium subglaciale]|nr:hypothetical protein E4T39_04561 [Aureobasidium subglaciale]